jgi:hypothetical protein
MVKCNETDCDKTAIYGITYKKGVKCSSHRDSVMVNVINKRCVECVIKRPVFGLVKSKPTHCGDCKTTEMFNFENKMCSQCDKKQPYYGLEIGKPTHCVTCKTPEMNDVRNKKCIKCNKNQPSFGLEGGGKRTHCSICKTDNMIDITHKKCIKCNGVQPYFGIEKNKATHCGKCKEPHMFDVINKLCFVCNIKKPTFGLEIKKTTHCADCKTPEMFDTLHKKCKTDLCNTIIYNPVYKGHCARCYGNLFPDSPLIRNFKTKERFVVDFIREQYPDLTWKFDKIVEDGCSRRRPDIYLDLGYQVIIIEVDENQHKFYENICENKRIMEISQDVGHRPIVFIRFNPHLASKTRCFATYFLYNKF